MSKLTTSYRSERSYGGYRFDELKSAIQKYIRRGETQKALRCYLEAESFAFPELEIEPRTNRGAGIRTNLIHRLMIIYLEDIGPANFELWSRIDDMLFGEKGMLQTHTKSNLLRAANWREKINHSIELGSIIVQELSNSLHSRHLSHVNLTVAKIEHLTPDEASRPLIDELRNEIGSYTKPDSSALIESLRRGSEASYYSARRILESPSPQKCYRSTKPIFYLIHLLSELEVSPGVIDMAVRWAKELTVSESLLIPYLVIAKILRRVATPSPCCS